MTDEPTLGQLSAAWDAVDLAPVNSTTRSAVVADVASAYIAALEADRERLLGLLSAAAVKLRYIARPTMGLTGDVDAYLFARDEVPLEAALSTCIWLAAGQDDWLARADEVLDQHKENQ